MGIRDINQVYRGYTIVVRRDPKTGLWGYTAQQYGVRGTPRIHTGDGFASEIEAKRQAQREIVGNAHPVSQGDAG